MGRRSAGVKKATTTTIGGFIGCGINHVVNPVLQHFGMPIVPPDMTPFITGGLGVACGAAFDIVTEKVLSRQEKKRTADREKEVRLKAAHLAEALDEASAKTISYVEAEELNGQLDKSLREWEGRLLSIDNLDATIDKIYGEYRKRAGLPIPKRGGRKNLNADIAR